MATAKQKAPIIFHVIPVNKGLNYSVPPQLLDQQESPASTGLHLYHGQLASRFGYERKYAGADEGLAWIDVVYIPGGASAYNVAFSYDKVYMATDSGAGAAITYIPVCYKFNGTTAYYDYYSWAPSVSIARTPFNSLYISVDAGTSKYFPVFSVAVWGIDTEVDCGYGNGGTAYPTGATPTSQDYANLTIFSNPADTNVYVLVPGSGGLACDTINDGAGNTFGAALMGGGTIRAVCMFDNRLVVGGGANNSQIIWSSKGIINGFNFATFKKSGQAYAPFADSALVNLADSPDWIQSMHRLGEYLVVYKERSIYLGKKTTDPTSAAIEFDPVPTQGIGCSAPNSIGDLGNEHIFLGWDNVYVFSLNGIDTVGDKIKDELFYGSNGIMPQYLGKSLGVIAEEFDEYWLFISTGRMGDNWLGGERSDICNVAGYIANFPSYAKPSGGTLTASAFNPAFNYLGSGLPWGVPPASPIGWTVSGTGATLTSGLTPAYPVYGYFGKNYAKLNFSSGNSATMSGSVNQQPIGSTVGYNIGDIYSGIVWVSNPNSFAVDVTLTMGNLTVTRTVQPSSSPNYSMPIYIALSGTVTSGSTVTVKAVKTGGGTGAGTLNIYGIQVCDIDMLAPGSAGAPNQHNPSHAVLYRTSWTDTPGAGNSPNDGVTLDGYVIPGYNRDAYSGDSLWGDYAPQMLPFITDRIGSWLFDTVWVYNYKYDAWNIWRLPASGFGYDTISGTMRIADLVGTVAQQGWRYDEKLIQTQAPTNLIGREDGQIYEMSKSYSYDFQGFLNIPIFVEWESKDFDGGDPAKDTTFSRLVIHHKADHPATVVQVALSEDSGRTWSADVPVTIRNGQTDTFVDFFNTGNQHRFRVKTEEGPIAFNGFSVKIVPRGEANAY